MTSFPGMSGLRQAESSAERCQRRGPAEDPQPGRRQRGPGRGGADPEFPSRRVGPRDLPKGAGAITVVEGGEVRGVTVTATSDQRRPRLSLLTLTSNPCIVPAVSLLVQAAGSLAR